MNVKDKSISAYEVLTRIVIGDRVVPAADFIEAAENMGAIGKIDYQLIEQAFIIVKERKFTGTLFLNLSPKAMVINDFMPTIRALFRDYAINPGDMVFEITERDTVKNIRLFEQFVHTLKDEGFRFAIDDFGAGYSSFQYLKTFPIDYLKVDGEFIRSMGGNGSIEKEIVSSIAALADRIRSRPSPNTWRARRSSTRSSRQASITPRATTSSGHPRTWHRHHPPAHLSSNLPAANRTNLS